MSTTVINVKKNDGCVARAKDWINELRSAKPKAKLFDEFWREGELALFFGATGRGKSLLAVQIADALARGTAIHGFAMPKGRKRVLYVDLTHSGPQFLERYRDYKFAHDLYRGQPDEDADHFEWIKAAVEANDIQVVIVDDLSAVKHTNEGIRETLLLMRRLKQLCRTHGISVLAISDASDPKTRLESEEDLDSSKVLCRVADSVFSIAKNSYHGGRLRLVQSRSRGGKIFWLPSNGPLCDIKRFDSGLLGLEFDDRFTAKPDEEKCRLICDIHWRHEDGQTFRSIAKELGLPTTTVFQLSKKWTPKMGGKPEKPKPETVYVPPPNDEYDEYDDLDPEAAKDAAIWLEVEREQALQRANGEPSRVVAAEIEEEIEEKEPPRSASIYDLELDYDQNGFIYVESREEHSGKPAVWYKPTRSGSITKCTRKPCYISVEVFPTDPLKPKQITLPGVGETVRSQRFFGPP